MNTARAHRKPTGTRWKFRGVLEESQGPGLRLLSLYIFMIQVHDAFLTTSELMMHCVVRLSDDQNLITVIAAAVVATSATTTTTTTTPGRP